MKRIYPAVFLVSCSILMFEVALIRIFSIHLWYHFAFMVISIAMLGIGSAGTVLAIYSGSPDVHNKKNRNALSGMKHTLGWIHSDVSIALFSALAGISVFICYIVSNYLSFEPVRLSWEKTQLFYLALYCLVLSVPFFFSGAMIATAFMLHSSKSMFIYAADLLGAGTGSLAILFLLNSARPEYAVLAASSLSLAGSLIAGKKMIRVPSFIFLVINVVVFFTHPDFLTVAMSPYKNLSLNLKYPGAEHLTTHYSSHSQIDVFKSPAVRFAPGLSLKYLKDLPDQIGLSIDGDRISAITDVRDKKRLEFIEYLPSSAAYEIGGKNDVLVLDPEGGMQALAAEHYGALQTHKVESNPLTVKVIRDNFRAFTGGLFDNDTWTGYGRSWLQGVQPEADGSRGYDVIDILMAGTSVGGIYGISEDYRYTVEAFKEYLGALKREGILSISLYLIPPPRTEFRIASTIAAAFEERGVQEVFKRIIAIRSWDIMTVLAKRSPFTHEEIEHIKNFSESRRFDLVYYPGIRKEETNRYVKMSSNVYFEGIKKIMDPETRSHFTADYLFDIKPVYDDNPFFHYYLRVGNIKAIYEKMGHKWLYFLNEGYLLPFIFMTVLILGAVIIMLPVLHKKSRRATKSLGSTVTLSTLLYFAMLGLGFMFVEVPIVHQSILLLENPSYAFTVVLTAILVSSGIGSMLGSRFSQRFIPNILLMLVFLIFVYCLVQPLTFRFLTALSYKSRIAAIAMSLIPLGLFMGIPFPAGIRLIGKNYAALIPWAWAINACLSVLAPVLTIMLAIITGFKAVLWIGVLAYLGAFIALKKLTSL